VIARCWRWFRADFQVVDPLQQVDLLSEDRHVDIEALHDPRYDGKAVVVEIFGTWSELQRSCTPADGDRGQRRQAMGR
jgi:hypothetical protein